MMILVLASLYRTKLNNNHPILDDSSHPLLDDANCRPILDASSHPLLDDANCHPILDGSTTMTYFSIYPLDHNLENRYIHCYEYLILQFITTTI